MTRAVAALLTRFNSCVSVQLTASDRRLGNSPQRFRYLATYFSRSPDRNRPAKVETAGFLHGSDLLRSLESPSVPPSEVLVVAADAQAGGSRERVLQHA